MQELSVYYCTSCGHYGYYQLKKHAVCPACKSRLRRLALPLREFLELDQDQRDQLLSSEILKTSPFAAGCSLVRQTPASSPQIAAVLVTKIAEQDDEIKKLTHQVTWMHDLIWEMVKKEKEQKNEPSSEE